KVCFFAWLEDVSELIVYVAEANILCALSYQSCDHLCSSGVRYGDQVLGEMDLALVEWRLETPEVRAKVQKVFRFSSSPNLLDDLERA
uniref:Uncharacterized protein n=1 Tax=Oryza brachyantha TaxID=4533 RepID=J3LJV5_ORYBR